MAVKFSRYDTADYFKNEDDILAYLDAVMEDGELGLIAAALGDVARARNLLPEHPRLYRLGRIEGTREMVVRTNYVVVYMEKPLYRTYLTGVARSAAMAAG